MPNPAYLRQPSLRGDAISLRQRRRPLARPASQGGPAQRLTAGLSEPSTPCLSPDGRSIAYVGRDEQHPEVWLLPLDGGNARRMTWLGPDVMVRGWTPNGHILFVTTHGQPFFRNYRAHTHRPGRRAAAAAAARPGGPPRLRHAITRLQRRVIGRNTTDPARWKRYRGGTRRASSGSTNMAAGSFVAWRCRPATRPARCGWAGASTCLSDHEGVGNLYSCRPDGSDLAAPHRPCRLLCPPGVRPTAQRIVYQCAGDLVALRTRRRTRSRRLDIDPARPPQRRRRGASCRPPITWPPRCCIRRATSLALDVRGRLFTMPLWEGAVQQHGPADGARLRHGQWLADGRTLVVVSDASGEEQLEVHVDGEAHPLPGDIGRVTALRAAPSRPARGPGQPPQRAVAGRPGPARRTATATAPSSPAPTTARTAASKTSPGHRTAPGWPTRPPPAHATARSSSTAWPTPRRWW